MLENVFILKKYILKNLGVNHHNCLQFILK